MELRWRAFPAGSAITVAPGTKGTEAVISSVFYEAMRVFFDLNTS